MSDEAIANTQERATALAALELLDEENDVEEPVQPASEEELVEKSQEQGTDESLTLDDWQRSQQIASAYIGGGRLSHKTRFTERVSGPVHSGSGDIHVHYGLTQSDRVLNRVERVSWMHVAKTRTVHVPFPLHQQAQKVLEDRYVLVLPGHIHGGKRTTALHLLLRQHDDAIFEFSPDVHLHELLPSEIETGRGYLIDTLTTDMVARLNSFVLNRLSNLLKAQNSHMVITVDSQVPLSRATLGDYVVLYNQAPERARLLETHLDWYLDDEDMHSRARASSQEHGVQQLLADLAPREIDHLAQLLAEVVRGSFQLEEALSRFQANARQEIAGWFEEHTDLEQRTFMLALAVFNGAKYQTVVDSAKRLRSLIASAPVSEGVSTNTKSIFEEPRSRWMQECCAHIVHGYDQTEFGQSPVERIELNNPAFQPAILNYVWDEYDGLRGYILDWLRASGTQGDLDLRDRAAAALGELGKYDFVYVQWAGLLPWAKHQNNRVRTATALALGTLAWDDEFATQVLKLLRRWSAIRNNWRLCWTAAAVYGGPVGQRFPEEALDALLTLVQTEDKRLFDVVSRSVANLFQAGQEVPDYYRKALGTLKAWTDDPKASTTLTGLLIFLKLAQVTKASADLAGETWPTLVWLAQQDQAYRDTIISLWRRAFNTRAARELAKKILRTWLRLADSAEQLASAIEQFTHDMAVQGTEREQDRLRFYLDQWASDSRERSGLATRILATFDSHKKEAQR